MTGESHVKKCGKRESREIGVGIRDQNHLLQTLRRGKYQCNFFCQMKAIQV